MHFNSFIQPVSQASASNPDVVWCLYTFPKFQSPPNASTDTPVKNKTYIPIELRASGSRVKRNGTNFVWINQR
jgi:hypothetical protein